MDKSTKIFVAGHKGLVGGAFVRELKRSGFTNIITKDRKEVDLLSQAAVTSFFEQAKPTYVCVAAAKVGGILANSRYQADFLYENLVIATNILKAAADFGTKKLLFLGSSCIYPKFAPQPIREDSLLTGPLEPTNEGYAIAKIAALKLCDYFREQYGKDFISAMPCNLYGIGDNFHPENSHVIPALLRRFHEAKANRAKTVTIWGSGTPLREFLYVDDLAKALMVLMERYSERGTINVGFGSDQTIRELASTIAKVVGFQGNLEFDATKPDGTPRKIMDSTRMHALGWKPEHSLEQGLRATYDWAIERRVFDS